MSFESPSPINSVNGQAGDVVITIDELLPSQPGNGGKFLQTDGTVTSWQNSSGFSEELVIAYAVAL